MIGSLFAGCALYDYRLLTCASWTRRVVLQRQVEQPVPPPELHAARKSPPRRLDGAGNDHAQRIRVNVANIVAKEDPSAKILAETDCHAFTQIRKLGIIIHRLSSTNKGNLPLPS